MQIIITAEEIKQIRVWLDPIIASGLMWLIKTWLNKAKEAIHAYTTENSNRIRDEVLMYVDKKFTEHENTEIECIKNLKAAVEQLKLVIAEIKGQMKEK